jgi:DNA repair protein RadD
MSFQPRPYQIEAINAAVTFFKSECAEHGILICPTGSGKSVIIANIAAALEGKTVVFQPSKEILEQNFAKYVSYGFRASIYSASAGMKQIDQVTFVTIGSVARKPWLFKEFKNIIIDECHLTNAKGGMYNDFINAIEGCKVVGLTATPYRLSSDSFGAMLKFLTRTRPRIFTRVLYYIQNDILFTSGYLARLEYFRFSVIDRSMLTLNSSGTDFTEASLKNYYRKIDMPKVTMYWANRLLVKRKNLLIFCALIQEARDAARGIPGAVVVTGETESRERERILSGFKSGKIKCVINVGVLTTGFDYPQLEAVLIARSTMSLALYYQMVGRAMRPHPEKDTAWIVDLGGNIDFFGRIETMKISQTPTGLYFISNVVNGRCRQLTNVPFSKN